MTEIQGRRVRPSNADEDRLLLEPGAYGRHPVDNRWYGCAPNGLLASLSGHDVVEHEDGTITVSPSILVTNSRGMNSWHGYLIDGVWKEID